MPPIRAIFFDIGDTLIFDNPPLRERLWKAMEFVGVAADKARLPEAFREGERYAITRYVQGVPWDEPEMLRETVTRILAAFGLPPLDAHGHDELVAVFSAVPFQRHAPPEVIPLLRVLRQRGFTLGGISDWEDTLPSLLAELGIAPYFDALAVSDIVGVRKPNRQLFDAALWQVEVAPENALHVGDWYELDVCGARAAGMQALLFDWRGRRPEYDGACVRSFEELSAFLLALPDPK